MSTINKVNAVSYGKGMQLVDGVLNGKLVNAHTAATTVGNGADGSSLTNGSYMFYNSSSLTSFTSGLPELTNAIYMFSGSTSLTSFTGDLPELTSGGYMFSNCTSLTSFTGDLPKLTNGNNMFNSCSLDEASVLRILNSIPTYTSGSHPLHLGKRTNFLNSTAIATLLGTTTPIAASTSYNYKGWTITVTN